MEAIYLDHAATSPLRPEVRDAMEPYGAEIFGNPSSVHRWGRAARQALEEAREGIADLLAVRPGEVVFVRGGTEADNLAVLGRARLHLRREERARVVVSSIEHSAVREAAEQAEREGAEVLVVPVEPGGRPDFGALEHFLEHPAAVVSMMWVNNETGIVLPVEEVGTLCRSRGSVFHTDGVQALGRVPVRLGGSPLDLASFTGHKLGGPRGTGVLVRRGEVELEPLHHGGGQEDGVRPGTQDVAGAVGVWTAFRLALEEQEAEARRLRELRELLHDRLRSGIPDLKVHGEEAALAPHILNVGVPGVHGPSLVMSLDLEGIAVSQGSACASGAGGTSPVLQALYGEEAGSVAPLRFSLGRGTERDHVEEAGSRVVAVVDKLRRLERVR